MKTALHVSKLSICCEYGRTNIPFSEITHLEGVINYTIIHTKGGKEFLTSYTLKKFEAIIGIAAFVRTHKSFIINPLYMPKYKVGDNTLILNGNKTVRVSRRMMKSLGEIKV